MFIKDRLNQFFTLTFMIVITYIISLYLQKEYFQNETTTTQSNLIASPTAIPIDRTKLYGSLFLDNLDEIKKNMTNPDIKYDTKRLELFKYYDVLY